MVGEVGTGKTTLLNTLLGRLDEKTRVAFVFNTELTFNQLLNMAVVDLGLARPDEPLSVLEVFRRL
ncbi:MAG: general secretion pathway protein GspA, partial [Candidatus Aenigmarchaeota archaeon]|nr:general secretion pathway protein GspA [Candidatus Aenigmarchaeota archaeon]